MTEKTVSYVIKPILFLICLLPLTYISWLYYNNALGANPIEKVTRFSGDWALRFLLITLTVTPLRRMTGQAWLLRLRRMLGLFCFFYGCCHVASYVVLDQFFAWDEIWKDIIKRPYITIGMFTFISLVPLAVTSTNKMMKRLGGRNWKKLHQLVYVAGVGAVAHYLFLVKADASNPLLYGGALVVLLGYRAIFVWPKSPPSEGTPSAAPVTVTREPTPETR